MNNDVVNTEYLAYPFVCSDFNHNKDLCLELGGCECLDINIKGQDYPCGKCI